MAIVGKGKNHQDSAPIVGKSGIRIIHGDINLKIAKTPHFVNIMTYSAILKHLNVSKDVFIVGNVDTLCNFVAN